ncbi:GNAT family N-acetyltransferase [Cylindrospermum sp. FACHB-282]|uniref:GNAT family N-acetyltransferase n=1 Tax=Cylindrospermum sp. FACHB-282 TaxID=2692794 RepID=UPI0016842C95|nr:GNAT family N-acetyltransferase [Cylindrospermum sp. FACHB-282]MBD2386865.1 GNAT family N-acetyltransferase [Cylindrospermum sp. FACHB-282]
MDFTSLNSRLVCLEDEPFIFQLYASRWVEHLENWGWNLEQQEKFLRFQFQAQQHSYQFKFPDREHRIVLKANQPIGNILIISNANYICLADIALLPCYRNQGIGTLLIRNLLTEAANSRKPVHLQVERLNPAIHLYERLGFLKTEDTGTHFIMEWSSCEI